MSVELLICILALWTAFQLPLEFAFPEYFHGSENLKNLDYVKKSTLVIFAFGILVHFRTAYVDHHTDELVYDPGQIAKHYLSSTFFIDFYASFPFEYLIHSQEKT